MPGRMAPELAQHRDHVPYSYPSVGLVSDHLDHADWLLKDIWSLGSTFARKIVYPRLNLNVLAVTVFAAVLGKTPFEFESVPKEDVRAVLASLKASPRLPHKFVTPGGPCERFIESCLHLDPSHRKTAEELLVSQPTEICVQADSLPVRTFPGDRYESLSAFCTVSGHCVRAAHSFQTIQFRWSTSTHYNSKEAYSPIKGS